MLKLFSALLIAVGAHAESPVDANALFARIKTLAGEWQDKSTKGWTAGVQIRVIARGSAVLFESTFPDDRDAGMATLMYVDKGRLLLTHYCEAKNQPTLVASAVSADGNRIEFTFLSGTGMKSRDDGHMDKFVMSLQDENSYRSRWTWYSNGKEQWLEDIEHRRAGR